MLSRIPRLRPVRVSEYLGLTLPRTLYVTDLDGTLLTNQKTVSARTGAIFRRLVDREVFVTGATARSLTSVRRMLGDLTLTAPVIVHNGAVAVDLATGRPVVSHFLEAKEVDRFLEVCRRSGAIPLVHVLRQRREIVAWVDGSESKFVRQFWDDRPSDPRSTPVKSPAELPRSRVICISVITGLGDAAPIMAELLGSETAAALSVREDSYHPDVEWIEMLPQGVSKGPTARQLADQLGAERLIAFGDDLNDLTLFETADEAYAVGNAVPDILACATAVLASNDEDAVALWLEEHAVPMEPQRS